jgi:chromosome partitioning protein
MHRVNFMTVVIALGSQKGGVGKSTVARLVAREYAHAGWNVKIADLDISQSTSFDWHLRRLQQDLKPSVAVERFSTVEQALKAKSHYDLIVLDGAPHSTAATLKMVEASTLAVLPTGLSIEDLKPQVLLAHELVKKGVGKQKLIFALCRVGESEPLQQSARGYIRDAGYTVLAGSLPEKLGYLKAAEKGRSLTETRFRSLNKRAAEMVQGIIDLATKLDREEAA